MTGKWKYLKKAIRISNYLSWEGIVCGSAELSALCPSVSLFPISVFLSLSGSLRAVMSGREAMLCWFIAWLLKWNLDGIRLSVGHRLDRNTCDAQGRLTAPSGISSPLSHQSFLHKIKTHLHAVELHRYTIGCRSEPKWCTDGLVV